MISNDKAGLAPLWRQPCQVIYEAPVEGGMNRFMAVIEIMTIWSVLVR